MKYLKDCSVQILLSMPMGRIPEIRSAELMAWKHPPKEETGVRPNPYVQDIAGSGFVNGYPFITAWVVGQSIAAGVGTSKSVGGESRKYGQVRATTYGALVSTANLSLMRLWDYSNIVIRCFWTYFGRLWTRGTRR